MKTVLIADDEANLRLLVMATFKYSDYQLIEAADGDEAWRKIKEHRPDLVLLDVQMRGQTGLELTRAIKSDPLLAGTWAVLLTSKAQAADVAAGLAAGADHYLTKPFSPRELRSLVDAALRRGAVPDAQVRSA